MQDGGKAPAATAAPAPSLGPSPAAAATVDPNAPEEERPGPGTPRYNAWTTEEFADLVAAWETAINHAATQPRSDAVAVHNETYKRFVVLRGGSTRRNKAAITSKRSALKFSYIFIRDFNAAQTLKKEPPFFQLPPARRADIMRSWKQINSSVVDLTSELYDAIARIMAHELTNETSSVGSRDSPQPPPPPPQAKPATSPQPPNPSPPAPEPPTHVDAPLAPAPISRVKGKRAQNTNLRASSNPWTVQEMMQLVQAWAQAADVVCKSTSTEPLSIIHEMYRQFEALQGGKSLRNLSGLATRRRVLRLSYSRVSAFNRTQKQNGEPLYAELPLEARLAAMRSWKNANLVDLTAELYEALERVIALDTQAVAMEDARRSKATNPNKISNAVSQKAQNRVRMPKAVAKRAESSSRNAKSGTDNSPNAFNSTDSASATTNSQPTMHQVDKGKMEDKPAKMSKLAEEKKAGKEHKATKEHKVPSGGPTAKSWSDDELNTLMQAWEEAAKLLIESSTMELMSLNREMYHAFLQLNGGSSTRNGAALASRRSSLKFSYARIRAFNDAQKLKNTPMYHELGEEQRLAVLRSWKNRNSIDLSEQMYNRLAQIMELDARAIKVQNARRSRAASMPKDLRASTENSSHHGPKTAKWTTEESSDLIQACADVMNVPKAGEASQTATEREALIYDRFVARRKNAGDTEASLHRDLRSMAQQWRYIMDSYAYIKTCNDKSAEMGSANWFDMPIPQRRAYQQCTNVPFKFVELNAEMFALITQTSFDEVVSPPLPSPAARSAGEGGVTLRPRTQKPPEQSTSESDSDLDSDEPEPSQLKTRMDKRGGLMARKGNSWPIKELWLLMQAWGEAVASRGDRSLTPAVSATFERFVELQNGSSIRNIHSVRNKMISLKSAYTGIHEFITKERKGDAHSWFSMAPDARLEVIATWKNKTIMDLNQELYDALGNVLPTKTEVTEGRRKSKRAAPSQEGKQAKRSKQVASQAADWSKRELLILADACGELLEGRRIRRYLFEEEKDRFYRRYRQLGGKNTLISAVSRARHLMDSYEFICAYNKKAAGSESLGWFELPQTERVAMARKVSKAHHNFSGLGGVDAELFAVVERLDKALCQAIGEPKKKPYKPSSDSAGSARYGDPETIVEKCTFRARKHGSKTKPSVSKLSGPKKAKEVAIDLPVYSSSTSDDDLEDSEDSASEYLRSVSSMPVSTPAATTTASSTADKRTIRQIWGAPVESTQSTPSQEATMRKRTREETSDSATLLFAQIIQKQNEQLEAAVKRFRKDGSEARQEHQDFLMTRIQEAFPVDNGSGSYLERVVELQGQTLADMFQRLQQQREVESAKDQQLMAELFGRSQRG